jgi:FkbM family methyltransferase
MRTHSTYNPQTANSAKAALYAPIPQCKKDKAASYLARIIPSGIHLPVVKGPLKGSKWIIGAAGGEGKGISTLFNYSEPGQIAQAMKMISPESVCFDIGANVGLYTMLFAKFGKYVYSFEPLPRNIRYLAQTLELNKIRNASIVPVALSDCTKMMRFKEGFNCAMGGLDEAGEIPVMAISCDDFACAYNAVPSLLKIDVEGAELAVLHGAKQTLSLHKPHILLSIHGGEMREACLKFLEATGYCNIRPINGTDTCNSTEYAVS